VSQAPREHRLMVPRAARVYSLGGERAVEAWVVLHGYGQLAGRFLRRFEPIAGPERLIIAPEALSRFYRHAGAGIVGASWMTREDREAEIRDYLGYLEQVRAALLPPVPLTLFGFSQGVATAARWVVSGTPAPRRLVCWGGLLPEDITAAGFAAVPVTFVVGDRDEWAPPERVEAQAAALRAEGVAVEVISFDGGHEIRAEVLEALV
jgi:predicted esterase